MVFGMLPLALALNDGGEIQAPMGRAIIGGADHVDPADARRGAGDLQPAGTRAAPGRVTGGDAGQSRSRATGEVTLRGADRTGARRRVGRIGRRQRVIALQRIARALCSRRAAKRLASTGSTRPSCRRSRTTRRPMPATSEPARHWRARRVVWSRILRQRHAGVVTWLHALRWHAPKRSRKRFGLQRCARYQGPRPSPLAPARRPSSSRCNMKSLLKPSFKSMTHSASRSSKGMRLNMVPLLGGADCDRVTFCLKPAQFFGGILMRC